jgi:ribosome-binding protein aMBF1 (putative translation factor)
MTPSQCRAARALVEFSQTDLATKAKVGESTVRNFEAGRTIPVTNNLHAIQRALAIAGVAFIAENGGGPGVRLRKSQRSVSPK